MTPISPTDREFWLAVRAAHIRRAKLLQQERDCIMEEIAAIERRWNIEPNNHTRQVRAADGDTVAGVVGYNQEMVERI